MYIAVEKCNNSLINIWNCDGAAIKNQGLKPILNNDKKLIKIF